MKSIKICGVPEHFNYPWYLCIREGLFEAAGIDLQWRDVPEGTGKMCEMLRNEETDVAVILTEGIVRDINKGNQSKIIQVYVESPLIWGIHVAAASEFHSLEALEHGKVAISRFGSGSQLMAYVNAENQHWNTENLQFKIVNTIDGAVKSLSSREADYFMWERFMTKPLVDNGTFRRIADCPTPWPCFVIAVREAFVSEHQDALKIMLEIINAKTQIFKQITDISSELAAAFNQKEADIKQWLSMTEWSRQSLNEDMLNKVQNQLLDLKLIDKKVTFTEIVKAF